MPTKTKNGCERRGKKQREEREVLLKEKGGQAKRMKKPDRQQLRPWIQRHCTWMQRREG